MKIGITGASGFVGKTLVRAATRQGCEVIAFSRDPSRIVDGCVETRRFSLDETPDFNGCNAIIHLAGENVAGLWTSAKVRRIRDSRVIGAKRVVEGIRAAKERPEVLIAASAIGIYGDSGDHDVTERSPQGTGFLAETCADNEAEVLAAEPLCRVVRARLGIVLGAGGALGVMRPIFKLGLGGPVSHGRQWMSWIHVEDAAAMLLFAVQNLDIRGALNATTPWPVTNGDFTKRLAKSLHRPAIFRAPAFALKLVLRGFADELLWSRRVLPEVATEHEFRFQFPELTEAVFADA
jgi:uncharacterized protein